MRIRVEAMVADIPTGQVSTYGDIAALAGYFGAARQVGMIARESTADLPWHRVVHSDGSLATTPYTPENWQRDALVAEGIVVKNERIVDFARLRWVRT
jgi:methylated-DNA-protein-cysteine methyltransferase-like protein